MRCSPRARNDKKDTKPEPGSAREPDQDGGPKRTGLRLRKGALDPDNEREPGGQNLGESPRASRWARARAKTSSFREPKRAHGVYLEGEPKS